MTASIRPMAESLAIHAAILALAIALSGLVVSENRPVVIDFSLEDSCAPAASPPKNTAGKVEERRVQALPPPAHEEVRQPVPEKPAVEPKQTMPEPATEPDAVEVPPAPAPPEPARVSTYRGQTAASTDAAPRNATPAAVIADTATSAVQGTNDGGGTVIGTREAYLKANFAYIRDLIHRAVSYPPLARRMGWEGRVTVSFIVSMDGSVRDVKVLESSGRSALDSNALDTVSSASPFPPPPVEAEVVLPVVYKLY